MTQNRSVPLNEGAMSTKVLKTTYCINKIKNGYKDVEKKSSCLRVSSKSCENWKPFKIFCEIEREVVLDNHKQRWPTMYIIFMMHKTNDGFSRE